MIFLFKWVIFRWTSRESFQGEKRNAEECQELAFCTNEVICWHLPHLENASSRNNDTFGSMFSWAAVKPFVSSLNGLGLKLLGDLDALKWEAQVLIKREGPAMPRLSSALLPFILKSAPPPPIFNCQEEHGFHTIPTCSIFAYVGDAATGVGS